MNPEGRRVYPKDGRILVIRRQPVFAAILGHEGQNRDDDAGGRSEVLDKAVCARGDERLVDLEGLHKRAGLETHVSEGDDVGLLFLGTKSGWGQRR
jgi:hypothetical protein